MNSNLTINIEGQLVDFSSPKVMGIINVTPDSFFSGSRKQTIDDILKTVEGMVAEGVDILDIGGYSSRPGADDISEGEELERVLKPIEKISQEFPGIFLSIDTFRSGVAEQSIAAGAHIINDISAGRLDEKMLRTIAKLKVPYIGMHMKGTPKTMCQFASYNNLPVDVIHYFSKFIHRCNEFGIKDVIIDPGFGFAKSPAQSFELLKNLSHFKSLECPLLIGVSRKSMIWKTLGVSADEALNGTTALNTLALDKGANILRVHDVKEAREVIKLFEQIK